MPANGGDAIAYLSLAPPLTHAWEVGVLYGPHGAPDFFTDPDIANFFATQQITMGVARPYQVSGIQKFK